MPAVGRGPFHSLCTAGSYRVTGAGAAPGPQAGAVGRGPAGEGPRGTERGRGPGVPV